MVDINKHKKVPIAVKKGVYGLDRRWKASRLEGSVKNRAIRPTKKRTSVKNSK